MQYILSEGIDYQKLELASIDLSNPRTDAIKMDEWAYMLRSSDKELAFLYFEYKTERQVVAGMIPGKAYSSQWFNPRTGQWSNVGNGTLKANEKGLIRLPDFPGNKTVSDADWAMKLKVASSN